MTHTAPDQGSGRVLMLFDNHPLPMWVYGLESLRFLEVNDAAVHHYGWSRDEFLSMAVTDIRPPEDVPAFLNLIGSLRESYAVWRPLWRHRRKDGSVIQVQVSSQVLYVSGYSEEAFERQGQLTVGIELLPKPFTPGVLTAKIREILDRAP